MAETCGWVEHTGESLVAERVEGVAVHEGVVSGTVIAKSGRDGDGWHATVVLDV